MIRTNEEREREREREREKERERGGGNPCSLRDIIMMRINRISMTYQFFAYYD